MKEYIQTFVEGMTVHYVTQDEVGLLLTLIREVAAYERMSDCVEATEEALYEALFVKHSCNAILVEYQNQTVGFALYFHTFSTFLGKTNMYLEDIYVRKEMQKKGIGREMFRILNVIAKEEGCERFEWICFNWNEPSIKFYERMGAEPMNGSTTWRMDSKRIAITAKSNK